MRTKAAMWVCVLGVLAAPACSAGSPYVGPDHAADAAIDAYALRPADAGAASDASPVPQRDGATPLRRQMGDVACADFQDNDHIGLVDCADTVGCGTTPICCVGSTSAQCCMPPSSLAPVIALATCTGSVPTDCVSGMLAFGAPPPILATARADGGSCAPGAAIAPRGGDRSDGGLVARANVDTVASAVAIEATLGVSSTFTSTRDVIAVGLTAQNDLGTAMLPRVRPLVAVIVSATDQTIRAIAGDVAFPAHALAPIFAGSPRCSEIEVRIVTSPAGVFDAFYRPSSTGPWLALESRRPYDATPSAHVVTYGRSTSTGTGDVHAWVRSVSIGSAICDVFQPARSTSGAFARLPNGATAIRSVSRVGSLAVYEMGGAIFAAGVDGTGHLHPLNGPSGNRIIASGEAPFMASALADPELVAVGADRRVFFTGVDAAGTRSIGYLDFDAALASRAPGSTPRQIIAPSQVGALGVDGPAYFETRSPNVDGTTTLHRWVVFRAIVSGTQSELRAAELVGSSAVLGIATESRDAAAPPTQFYTSMHPTSPTTALYANRDDAPTAFDHDEIASPELVAYHGVIRVFFAARLGARWTIGMLRSPDFAHFQLAYPDPVLRGSGAGFDAVSVTDPDAWLDTSGTLTLYYTGSDGSTTEPGMVSEAVPTP